jgi:hypothetical protein
MTDEGRQTIEVRKMLHALIDSVGGDAQAPGSQLTKLSAGTSSFVQLRRS